MKVIVVSQGEGDDMKENTVKKETKATDKVVAAEVKTEEAVVKEEVKAPAKKETKAAKTATKTKATKTTAKTEEKAPAKKTTTKKAAAKKSEVMASVTLQFDGKAYTEKELTIIAKDVWKFDLGREEAEIKTIELYVKPEEGVCYYVFNSEVTGSFRV